MMRLSVWSDIRTKDKRIIDDLDSLISEYTLDYGILPSSDYVLVHADIYVPNSSYNVEMRHFSDLVREINKVASKYGVTPKYSVYVFLDSKVKQFEGTFDEISKEFDSWEYDRRDVIRKASSLVDDISEYVGKNDEYTLDRLLKCLRE